MGDVTPPLDDFLTEYAENDNEWWYLGSGDHLNLFDEAVDRMRAAEAAVDRILADVRWLQSNPNANVDTMTNAVVALRMLDLLDLPSPTNDSPRERAAETNEEGLA